jgi:hypothetical protein
MYKKHGRYDKDVESPNNDEKQFVTQLFNFMRKYTNIGISHVFVPKVNLDIDTRLTLNSGGSAPDNQKYHVDDIKEHTPCTLLLYVKGRTLRTIEVANTIVMSGRIMHGRLIPLECAVVKVTTMREGREFEDFYYLDEEEGIEKLKDAKGNFIL